MPGLRCLWDFNKIDIQTTHQVAADEYYWEATYTKIIVGNYIEDMPTVPFFGQMSL